MIGRITQLTCILVLSILPLAATTTNLIGVVVGVEVKKGRGDSVYYEVQIRNIWGFTMQPSVDDNVFSMRIHGGTFFLDGKPSTRDQAFKPGHLVKILEDVDYYECYSQDFHFDTHSADSLGADRGVYRLRLPGGANCVYRVSDKKGVVKEERSERADLYLHLLCRDGSIAAAAASQGSPAYSLRAFSLPVDASGLKISEGRIHGPVTVTLLSEGKFDLPQESGEEQRHFTIDAPLGQAEAEGSFVEGRGADDGKQHTLTITGKPEPVLGDHRAVILYQQGGTGGNLGPLRGQSLSLDARFQGDTLDQTYLSTFGKGGPSESTVASYDLQWDGPRFKGTIVIQAPGPDSPSPRGTLHVEGVLIGDQLFGSTRGTLSETHGELAGRLRGMILKPEAPPIIGWDEGMAKSWMKNNKGGEEPMPAIMLKGKR